MVCRQAEDGAQVILAPDGLSPRTSARPSGNPVRSPGEPARSFRDPDGCVIRHGGRIVRRTEPAAAEKLRGFLGSPLAKELVEAGHLVATWEIEEKDVPSPVRLSPGKGPAAWFEHERIPFPSYPYEWSPAMLHAAAALTVDLAVRLQEEGLELKDATPYNVMFRGPRPVFIDLLSIERPEPGDAVWRPYAQFASTFLLPLALARRFGLSLADLLQTNREGIAPDQAWRLLPLGGKIRSPFRELVTIPELLRRARLVRESHYAPGGAGDPERARFVRRFLFRRLRRQVKRLAPRRDAKSAWTGYMDSLSYAPAEFAAKEKFVGAVLDGGAARVLDVGCNTGLFSFLAARRGAEVVAIDYDAAVVDRVWREASGERLNVLPLAVNLARPTPATGWRNGEAESFLERAAGRFELVLMLAVIHHMLVTERVPLEEIMGLTAELTTRAAVVEYVDPADPMFRQIARGRDHLHADLNAEAFVRCAERWFAVEEALEVSPTRRLFRLRKR